VPWRMRAGLYRGAALGEAAREAYSRELNATLVPALRDRFELALQTNVATPDRLYEYLKGYLMLGDAKHRDPTQLRILSEREWTSMAPDATTGQRLSEHFEQLLSSGDFKSVPLNSQIIDQARAALRSASLPVLMFSRLKLMYHDDQKH